MSKLFDPLSFTRGPRMKNRFMLAPLTNTQSHADGVLSDEEFNWLTMRAKCGFGGSTRCPGVCCRQDDVRKFRLFHQWCQTRERSVGIWNWPIATEY